MKDLKIYVGFDSREVTAYQVAHYSIEARTPDVLIRPLQLAKLRHLLTRENDKLASTEFTYSRFLVPYLNEYKGWALYVDSDVLCQHDMSQIFTLAQKKYGVMCVKHNYEPTATTKMDNRIQSNYPRKNWSSVMLFNCSHPKTKKLTPELINNPEVTPAYLHQMQWIEDEKIGELPHEWNWLVNWYHEPKDGKPKLLHFTEGGPWFKQYFTTQYHERWKRDYRALKGEQFTEDMCI